MILIKLTPSTLLDGARLPRWLRHELMHVADMLDPHFGYEPVLPKSEAGPAYDHLIRERYRVLWDTCIDGRLWRRGWAAEGIREKRLAEFTAAFSRRGTDAQEAFEQWFAIQAPTHAGLLAFAQNTGALADLSGAGRATAQPCPLCRFPSFDLIHDADHWPAEVRKEIAIDFPHWQPAHGLCRQCADLYRAREMSRAAERALPGIGSRASEG